MEGVVGLGEGEGEEMDETDGILEEVDMIRRGGYWTVLVEEERCRI